MTYFFNPNVQNPGVKMLKRYLISSRGINIVFVKIYSTWQNKCVQHVIWVKEVWEIGC